MEDLNMMGRYLSVGSAEGWRRTGVYVFIICTRSRTHLVAKAQPLINPWLSEACCVPKVYGTFYSYPSEGNVLLISNFARPVQDRKV